MQDRPQIDENTLLFQYTSGPRNARVMLVGEAWSQAEALAHSPFQGSSDQELNRMLREAGLERNEILCSNVISSQPPSNDFTTFLFDNKEAKKSGVKDYHGIYPRANLAAGIARLWALIDEVKPDLIIAAGNWPLHILTPHATVETNKGYKLPTGITTWRGSQAKSRPSPSLGTTYNVLPIIHPAAVQREWSYRAITVHDLRSRAGRFLNKSLSWSPPPTIDIFMPTLDDVDRLLNFWIARALHRDVEEPFLLSVDIETYKRRFISCIGFADDEVALCIPFFYFDSEQRHVAYWSPEDELYIWKRIRYLLSRSGVSIVGQNFMYDTIFLERYYSVIALVSYDAGLMHHLLYPGTPKTLPRLASLYNHYYSYWKDESEDWQADETSAQDLWRYNCKDTRATLESVRLLMGLHKKRKGAEELYQWRVREWRMARSMAIRGIRYDEQRRRIFAEQLSEQIEPLQQFLLRAMPESIRFAKSGKPWYDSNTTTMDIFYRIIGVGKILHKKTRNATFDDSAINALIEDPKNKWLLPILERLSAYRSAQVFNRNFIKVKLSPDGRLRTQFKIDTPETFRWSSNKNPFDEGGNLQNLPKVEVD